ncbi:MAG TPA: S41 family peptidase [Gemmataceae bacterium]|jgi:carboxyl-terminal processing protease|nr:S41 family peptidase [Gemmataceae bacterium]
MPRTLTCLSLLLGCGLLLAANRLTDRPAKSDLPLGEAQNYAQQLNFAINEVVKTYVRPAQPSDRDARTPTGKDLAGAALEGLYEAARVPMPASLSARVQKAANEQQLVELIGQTRQSLGNPEGLRGSSALLVSLRSMTRLLDAHSVVVSGEEVDRGAANDLNQGVGLEVKPGAVPLTVTAVAPGGPAQRAGIRPGDRITHIDGRQADTVRWVQTQARLGNGAVIVQASTARHRVELTLLRPGTKGPRKVTLEQQDFRPETVLGVARKDDNSWDYLVDKRHKIAHVRLATLTQGTTDELAGVLTSLKAEGMRGLILDLRWCPGGFLDQAVEVPRLFLSRGTVCTFKGRDDPRTAKAGHGDFVDFPMVVLVNGETSGGAELIAAALQDNKRAAVAGQRTLGKASVQTMLPMPVNNTYIKVTSGVFVRPNGKNLHRFPDSKPADDWGVRPDAKLEFRVSADLGRQLREAWLLQTLRPGSSNEALLLDDPEKDPQRQAALEGLLFNLFSR